MTRLVYRLVGYNKKTDAHEATYDVPLEKARLARSIAKMAVYQVSDMPLSARQAQTIGEILRVNANTGRMNFFLEPYDADDLRESAA